MYRTNATNSGIPDHVRSSRFQRRFVLSETLKSKLGKTDWTGLSCVRGACCQIEGGKLLVGEAGGRGVEELGGPCENHGDRDWDSVQMWIRNTI